MPSSSSFCAMMSLSSTEKETASPCVPSRRVVSKVKIFIKTNIRRRNRLPNLGFRRYSYFFLLLEERHHGTKLAAHFFDGLVFGRFAHGEELVASRLVLFDPLPRKLARLNLGENLLHFLTRLIVHDARSASVIAIFGGIGNGVAHVAEAALLNQVDDQLQLVEALE